VWWEGQGPRDSVCDNGASVVIFDDTIKGCPLEGYKDNPFHDWFYTSPAKNLIFTTHRTPKFCINLPHLDLPQT
jgi:hypothetical protein